MRNRCLLALLICGIVPHVVSAAGSVTVKSASLSELAVYPERTAPATVLSLNESTISAEIAATVMEIPVRVGDIAEAGSKLLGLDCADYTLAERRVSAMLESLDARLGLAAKQLERAKLLERQQSVAVEAVDVKTSELAVLESEKRIAMANREVAARDVSRCLVVSPFRGLVTERISAVGEFASAGTPLVKIVDLTAIEVSAQVSSDEVVQIDTAEQIYFSYAELRYPLTLRTVLPAINPSTRSQEVRLEFEQTAAITGAAGKLIWSDYRPHLPADLLVNRDGQLGIFIFTNGTARFHPLEGAQAGRTTPVDLPADTQIIIEGHFSLQDNAGVQVTD